MLVLARKTNESIVIDGNIVVSVVEIRGDKVRLGITAPKEVSVHREEVQRLIERKLADGEGDSARTISGSTTKSASIGNAGSAVTGERV